MKVMVIGSGGREHVIIKKLKENPQIQTIYALPGNGGIANDAVCVNIGVKDIDAQVRFAVENQINYAVVTPDDPLVLGAVDRLTEAGIPCFGPTQRAAMIEGSKVFAKELMKKYGIPTAEYETFDNADAAMDYIRAKNRYPVVIKADGLALGKGVLICGNMQQAADGIKEIMLDKKFGASGNRVVVEEYLSGPEVSVLAFTDGKTLIPMISSMDHKRSGDFDTGLNTGGMGTIAPNPYYTKEIAQECVKTIFLPTVRAMNAEGRTFKGCLYFGLMLTKNGPKVIEYNCRFGDPEAQVVLPLLNEDLFTIMRAVTDGTLNQTSVTFRNSHAVCVIMASQGYPQSYATGFPISMDAQVKDNIFFAGVKSEDGILKTAGGRVLGVTAVANTAEKAVQSAYEAVEHIHFENAFFRHDIGAKACAAYKKSE